MRNKILLVVLILLFVQQGVGQGSMHKETLEIERVVKGYIENFFLNEYDKMEVFLHERLAKRGVNSDGELSPDYSRKAFKELMGTKPAMALKYQKNLVKEIKINNRAATAILETGYPKIRWKEYIHLVKLDGKWIILDVAWCFDKINN